MLRPLKIEAPDLLDKPMLEFRDHSPTPVMKNPHIQQAIPTPPSLEFKDFGTGPLGEDIKKGREFKALGEFDSALACFNLALEIDREHPIALRESFKVHLLKDDIPKAEQTINKLMGFYAARGKKNEALILFSEVMRVLPMHTFNIKSQKIISEWLNEIGDHRSALIAYRNFAYKFGKHPFAATSLLKAGLLCQDKLENPKLASKIFQLLLKNFPNSPEAIQAKQLTMKKSS